MAEPPNEIWATPVTLDGLVGSYATYESAWKEDFKYFKYIRAPAEPEALIAAEPVAWMLKDSDDHTAVYLLREHAETEQEMFGGSIVPLFARSQSQHEKG